MRTQEQIVERIKQVQPNDMLGFQWPEFLPYLDFEHAKQFLKPEANGDDWPAISTATGAQKIADYMPFAWEKANDQRGISANRSIEHMLAWLWLDESPIFDAVSREYESNYHHYGKPILEMICDHYGIDWKELDDGIRSNG